MPEKGLLLNEILANEFFDFSPFKLMPDRSHLRTFGETGRQEMGFISVDL